MNLVESGISFIGFDTQYGIAFYTQLISLLSLGWYVCRSFCLIIKNERKEKGIIPILGILYLLLSGWYIANFISNFDELIALNENVCRNNVSAFPKMNIQMCIWGIDILSAFVFMAFTFNFVKALYSINSLEMGHFQNMELKYIFGKSKFKMAVETILRAGVVFFFIAIEHLLSQDIFAKNENPQSFLVQIALFGIILYISLLLWHWFIISKMSKSPEMAVSKSWKKFTFIQLYCGLIIFIFFGLFGQDTYQSPEYYFFTFTFLALLGFICSAGVIWAIIYNEFFQKKLNATN